MHRTLSVGSGEAADMPPAAWHSGMCEVNGAKAAARSECAISAVQPERDTNNRVARMPVQIP